MNGASTLDCVNTISSPNRMNITTIGVIQYFFSSLRNWRSSDTTRTLDIIYSLVGPHPHSLMPLSTSAPRLSTGMAAGAIYSLVGPHPHSLMPLSTSAPRMETGMAAGAVSVHP
jgi:hypothetical protein